MHVHVLTTRYRLGKDINYHDYYDKFKQLKGAQIYN